MAMAFVLVSCNQKNKETEQTKTETSTELYACSMHPEVTGKKGEKCSKCGMELTVPVTANEEKTPATTTEEANVTKPVEGTQSTFSINTIVSNYLALKNALTKDDTKGAASAGKTLYATFNAVNATTIDAKQKKEYLDIADDAKEHAEHIGDNGGNIPHQREHFVLLSKDISDLIKTFGATQKLYQDYCPMADEGKGAIWISEIKDIKNPYQGSKILTCGSVKKTY